MTAPDRETFGPTSCIVHRAGIWEGAASAVAATMGLGGPSHPSHACTCGPRAPLNVRTESSLLLSLFDELGRLEAYERQMKARGGDVFRATAAAMLVQTQVRVLASTYRALVAAGALPHVGSNEVADAER